MVRGLYGGVPLYFSNKVIIITIINMQARIIELIEIDWTRVTLDFPLLLIRLSLKKGIWP